MSKRILITGGILRPNGFELGEGKYHEKATLLRLDLESGQVEEVLSLTQGNENFPDEYPNLEFTVGTIDKDKLWLTTDTEVRLYQYPDMKLLKLFSHPCFHNIHSVSIHKEYLYVTSTGLDMVVVMDKENGKIIQQFNAEGKETWHRFSSDIDYRKVHSTRPHDCHPNYVFWVNGEPWVTRCTQEDAVCLSDVSKRIDISGPDKSISVHDGIVDKGNIYFTSVDGCIVIADELTFEVKETIELYQYEDFGGIRGWCRGLYIENKIFYIGFSRLRKTKAKGKLSWLKRFANLGAPDKLSSVIAFDIEARKVVGDYHIPDGMIDAVYTIIPEPVV